MRVIELVATAHAASSAIIAIRLMVAAHQRKLFASRDDSDDSTRPPCLLIRPIAGNPKWLERALATTRHAVQRSDFIVFALASRRDPGFRAAVREAQRMRRDGFNVDVVLGGPLWTNGKASRLGAAVAHGSWQNTSNPVKVVVVADDDVALDSATLDTLVTEVHRANGAGFLPVFEDESGNVTQLGDRASAAILSSSAQSFVALGALPSGKTPTFVGKCFAVTVSALESIGGFGAVGDVLGEDHELARLLSRKGLPTTMLPIAVPSLACGRTLRATFERYTRWLMVVRLHRPLLLPSYLLLAPCWPALIIGSIGLLLNGDQLYWILPAVTLVFQLLLAICLNSRLERDRGDALFLDVLIAQSVLFAALLNTLVARSVVWRGQTLTTRVGAQG